MSGESIEERRNENSTESRSLLGMIRRMVVSLSGIASWQFQGHRLITGIREVIDAEVFSGVGFFARPRSGAGVEAIMVAVGAARDSMVAVAMRDERGRAKYVRNPLPDETYVYNSKAKIAIRNGQVAVFQHDNFLEVEAVTTVSETNNVIAKLNEVISLLGEIRTQFNAHTHPVSGSTAAVTPVQVIGATPSAKADESGSPCLAAEASI